MRTTMIAAAFVIAIFGGYTTFAQETTSKGAQAKAKWESLTPAQQETLKAEFKEKAKEKWEAMTPEERETAKAKFKDNAKTRWSTMTPEEREAAKAKMKENREKRRNAGK